MIQETRRQILRLIGLSPVAASSASAQLNGLMGGPTGALLSAASATVQSSLPGVDNPVAKALGPTVFRRLAGLHQRVDRELWDARAIRQNGLDADIAALRSTAQVWKARKQFERDSEAFHLWTRLQGMLWP